MPSLKAELTRIIEILQDPAQEITEAFLRLKVIMRMGNLRNIVDWIDKEMEGYSPDQVPSYRIIPCLVKGTVSNWQVHRDNVMLPLSHLEPDIKQGLEEVKLPQGIAELEALGSESNATMSMTLPPEFCSVIQRGLANEFQLLDARRIITSTQVGQVLFKIRNRLLDFVLELIKELPEVERIDVSTKDTVERAFATSVVAHNSTVVIGSNNANISGFKIEKGDLAGLSAALGALGIKDEFIQELIVDLEDANTDETEKKLKVQGWKNRMINRVSSGAWNVSISAAGQILGNLLGQYFGLSS